MDSGVDDGVGVLGGGVFGTSIFSALSFSSFTSSSFVMLLLLLDACVVVDVDEGGGIGNIRSSIPTCAHNAGRVRSVNRFRLITKRFSVGIRSLLSFILSFESADLSLDMLLIASFSENCLNTWAETRCVV